MPPQHSCCCQQPQLRGRRHADCKQATELMLDSGAGTFAGLTEKLDHLQRLGINCLELLPPQEFNEMESHQV